MKYEIDGKLYDRKTRCENVRGNEYKQSRYLFNG